MRPGSEVDRSLPSSTEVKNKCRYNFITSVRLPGDVRDTSAYRFYLKRHIHKYSDSTARSVLTVLERVFYINTFAASYLNTQGLNNSYLKSPASTLVDLTFQSRALRSFRFNQLRNLSL